MKIGLLGYGKMGKAIERIALEKGHQIVFTVDENTTQYDIKTADVIIEFSIPTVAPKHLKECFENGVPVVCGTTGWLEKFDEITALCREKNGGFLYASNFSLGVNIFFQLNEYLAKLMANFPEYKVDLEEIHHKQKLDEPSGTAITLTQPIITNHQKYDAWALDKATNENEIPVKAIRSPEVPGTHTVAYRSKIDTIDIKHEAHNRQGFALGAVVAAEWLTGRHGIFTMKDVLAIKKCSSI